jgi:pyruvate dehydrogenase E2 component (dihydrolipoamide acetyltransferase)
MATKVVMEALSPTMEEGRLVEWKKNEGDAVAVGDVLAEVETDKAVMELAARAAGTLLKQAIAAGSTAPVGALVGWIGAAGEAIPGADPTPVAPSPSPAAAPATATAPPSSATVPGAAPSGGRLRASPLARRIAAEQGVDLSRLAGSGPEGRIVKRDLEAAAASPAPARPALANTEAWPTTAPPRPAMANTEAWPTPAQPRPALANTEAWPSPAAAMNTAVWETQASPFSEVQLSQVRKTIAKRLVQSIGPIPTYYLTVEADMERAFEAREALLAADDQGKFSFNDLVIRSAAAALRQHPWINSWWLDDRIRQWHDIHIGVAVATDEGLITPVIRHADRKSLREIAGEVRQLAARARERKLKPEEYTGSTFSISNLGMFGIDEFTAIINPPEAAILAIGRLEEKAVVVDGALAVRHRMRMTMSCDHRVIDGATGAAFLKTLVAMLENPLALVW